MLYCDVSRVLSKHFTLCILMMIPYLTVKMGEGANLGGMLYCDVSRVLSKHLTLCILMILPNILIQ